jgi:26S proteasome regulatory subunit N1
MAQDKEAQAESISVLSEDPIKNKKKDAEGLDDKQDNAAPSKDAPNGKKEADLSEEDEQLKNELEMLVERLQVSS